MHHAARRRLCTDLGQRFRLELLASEADGLEHVGIETGARIHVLRAIRRLSKCQPLQAVQLVGSMNLIFDDLDLAFDVLAGLGQFSLGGFLALG